MAENVALFTLAVATIFVPISDCDCKCPLHSRVLACHSPNIEILQHRLPLKADATDTLAGSVKVQFSKIECNFIIAVRHRNVVGQRGCVALGLVQCRICGYGRPYGYTFASFHLRSICPLTRPVRDCQCKRDHHSQSVPLARGLGLGVGVGVGVPLGVGVGVGVSVGLGVGDGVGVGVGVGVGDSETIWMAGTSHYSR